MNINSCGENGQNNVVNSKEIFAEGYRLSSNFRDIYDKVRNGNNLNCGIIPKKHRFIKVFSILILIFGVSCGFIYYYFFGGIQPVGNVFEPVSGIWYNDRINNKIINIAVFGVDKRGKESNGRSDTTMIVSLDGAHKKLKFISLLRDGMVNIPKHGEGKLCHAYSYGGADLAIQTINKNFKLDINDYVTVDFSQMAKCVDAVGGLDLEITKEELNSINGLLDTTEEFVTTPRLPVFFEDKKVVHLNGAQVLSYARIRKIDSEVKRVDRQHKVLELLFNKIIKMNAFKQLVILNEIKPFLETKLSVQNIMGFIPFIVGRRPSIERCKIPDIDTDKGVVGRKNPKDKLWYWEYDVKKQAEKLRKFIYEV